MPNYFYKATDPAGKWLSGEVQGATREQAEARLLERGLLVEDLSESESAPTGRDPGVDRGELLELVEQLAALGRAGLPLPSGLRAAGMEVGSRSLRAKFFAIAELVESGGRLEGALERASRHFPPDLRGLIAAGSRTGRLAEMLGEYVRAANLGSELRRMLAMKLAYPAAALVLLVGLVGFLCSLATRAVASLVGTMRDFGARRTTMAEGVSAMAGFINDHGWTILGVLLGGPVLAWLVFRFGLGPARRRRALCAIPAIGPAVRFASLAQFCHLMAMLVEAETPLPLAFELAGSGVRDADLAEACARMGRAVESGEPMATALGRWPAMPAGLGQLFRWSEDRRRLPESLHLAGDMFESRARSQANYAGNVMATFLLLLILWWIGFAIAALYMPLVTVLQLLSGMI